MINKLALTNWMGHDNLSIEFKNGKNLVYGKNASGKSSLAKAIAFNLTGLLHKKCDPRRNNKTESIVDLEISAQNESYLIRRQVNKGRRLSHTIFIYDSKDTSKALYTDDEAENFLQDLLGLSATILQRIVYMKEEDVHDFLANPGSGVLTEIDQMIGLEKAHETRQVMDNIITKLKSKRSFLGKEIREIDAAVRRPLGVKKTATDVKKAEKRLVNVKSEMQDLLTLRDLISNKNTLSEQIDAICEKLNIQSAKDLEKNLIEIQLQIQKQDTVLKKEIKDKEDSVKKELISKKSLEKKFDKLDAQVGLRNDIIKILLDFKDEGKITSCPTCGRDMDNKLYKETKGKLETEIKELEKKKSEEQQKIQRKEDIISQLHDEISKLEGKLAQLYQKYEFLKNEKTKAESILSEISSVESLIKKYKDKKYPLDLVKIDAELDKLDEEDTKLRTEIAQAQGAKEATAEHLESLKVKEEDIKHKLKVSQTIFNAALQTANELRRIYVSKVKNLAEVIWEEYKGERWEIDWDNDFVPIAKSSTATRFLTAYEMSGSERFLILLSIRLAMLQTLDKFQLLIIDEPCQHLDEANGIAIREIITNIEEDKIKQSIVFTFNPDYVEGTWSNIVKLPN